MRVGPQEDGEQNNYAARWNPDEPLQRPVEAPLRAVGTRGIREPVSCGEHRGDEELGVGLTGIVEHLVGQAGLDHPTGPHHYHPVRQIH